MHAFTRGANDTVAWAAKACPTWGWRREPPAEPASLALSCPCLSEPHRPSLPLPPRAVAPPKDPQSGKRGLPSDNPGKHCAPCPPTPGTRRCPPATCFSVLPAPTAQLLQAGRAGMSHLPTHPFLQQFKPPWGSSSLQQLLGKKCPLHRLHAVQCLNPAPEVQVN